MLPRMKRFLLPPAMLLLTHVCACTSTTTSPGHDASDTVSDVQTADVPLVDALPGPDPLPWVHTLIGSGGAGNVFVGATLPHGMVKLGPDHVTGSGNIQTYAYDATRVQGFSHTHLDGPGGSSYGYSQIALLPTMGTRVFDEDKYAATFSHVGEVTTPASYAVQLVDPPIHVDLTATAHCGVHRYQFPAGTARVLLDLGHTRGDSRGGHIAVDPTGVHGRGDYSVHPLLTELLEDTQPVTGLVTVHFTARFNRAADRTGLWKQGQALPDVQADGANLGAWLEFDATQPQTIEARVCLSLVSETLANQHLQAEVGPGATWETVRDAAALAWRTLLGRVQVQGGTDADKARFYTALYHSLLQPADYTEDGQFWNGSANPPAAQSTEGRRYYTDDWCYWDTARTTHPLLTLIEPEVVEDMAQSLLWLYQKSGWLPKCTWHASGDSRVMTGNFQFSVLADAAVKGLTKFDTALALEAMQKGSQNEGDGPGAQGFCGMLADQGTPPGYVAQGYVADQCDHLQAASMTLEYAYADWTVAQFAQAIGRPDVEAKYRKRAENWRNVWNPAHQFPQLRKADGTWVEPFDPTASDGFTEATAWIYSWFVPQDRCGLVEAMGGRMAFVARLDEFFTGNHFDMGNEPDFHAPWLYLDVGRPDKTSDLLRKLMDQHFADKPDGLPGNDDAGATSAWFVFTALGLYPVAPGDGWYALGSPVFPRATLLVAGRVVTIEAEGTSPDAKYVQSATWNGKPVTEARIRHADLAQGGTLHLTMGPQPSAWATQPRCP
jgi:predicted alpha-1,2-mannosidase